MARITLPGVQRGERSRSHIYGVTPGEVRTSVSVYAPKGSLFTGSTVTGAAAQVHTAIDSGYPVGIFVTQLAPGQSTVVRLNFLGAPHQTGSPVVDQTPVIALHPAGRLAITCK